MKMPTRHATRTVRATGFGWRPVMVITAFVMGTAARFVCGSGASFWFDETFTAVIASQRTIGGLIGWCLHELTGPDYYMPLWVWEKFAGSSDMALRFPSILASFAAPALLLWCGHPNRDIRYLWATFAALWVPGIEFAADARPYSLLFLLGCAQAIAFLRLMHAPRIQTALAWTSVSALFVLTHYDSVGVAGLQGIAYLAVHRRVAVRTWPSLAPLVPMSAWMTLHVPFVLGYATSGAWYGTLPLRSLLMIPSAVFGSEIHGAAILLIVAGTLIYKLAVPRSFSRTMWSGPEAALMFSGIAAFALIFGMGFVRPGFALRYLISGAPALLFALAVWGEWSLAGRPRSNPKLVLVVVALMGIMVIGAVRVAITHPADNELRQFTVERASAWLMERHPARLVFFWDSSAIGVNDPVRIAEVGSFFFTRAGDAIVTTVPHVPAGLDPTAVIASRTANDHNVAVLWAVTDRAMSDPTRYPHLDHDHRWECRNFGGATTIIVACRRPA